MDGPASREQGRFLNELSTLRKQADYGVDPVDADIGRLVERTERFVTEMAALLDG